MSASITEVEGNHAERFRKRLTYLGLISTRWLLRFQHPNGGNRKITFREVWELYQKDHLPTLSEAARVLTLFRCERFMPPLFSIRMCELNPQVISEFIRYSKERAAARTNSRRKNFDKELKDLRTLCNWYRDTIDFQFATPVNRTHYKLAVIAEIPKKQRQISIEQFQLFLKNLPEFYAQLATIQFFCAARIGEVTGLQWKNVDLEKRILTIQEVLVWIRGQGAKVKNCPKNGLSREVYINDTMLEILRARLAQRQGSDFVFHREGKPLLYGAINTNFNKAWKKAGLEQFRGTHSSRYASAQNARRLTGSIDGAKAVTGHVSTALAHQYSDYTSIDQNRASVEKLEAALCKPKVTA